jgi:hypothetical protein
LQHGHGLQASRCLIAETEHREPPLNSLTLRVSGIVYNPECARKRSDDPEKESDLSHDKPYMCCAKANRGVVGNTTDSPQRYDT